LSGRGRFWLVFHLPKSVLIEISIPTIACSMVSM
jgi:hypothetical protein